jgi:UDP:flavonoid glycosyltransferase YjiC (YdhE family)
MRGREVLVATWGGGGNLPPLLAVARLLEAGGHRVRVLGSGATRPAAERAGFEVVGYRRSPDPEMGVAFEAHADHVMATAAGPQVAADVRDLIAELRPDLLIADCMLPAALVAAEASGTPSVAVVHFLYGPARLRMLRTGHGWTTDMPQLNLTRASLGLGPVNRPQRAWERPDLLLVTAPRWFDVEAALPRHVVHAGPLGVRTAAAGVTGRPSGRPRVLVSFSTSVMERQADLAQAVCEGLAEADVEALLTLGPALGAGHLRLPPNVTAVPFADHDDVLPGAAAVVGHGGLGTTLRALAHGVPQLILPLGRDQHVNAGRVADLGAGMTLPADSPPARIGTALRQLLTDDRFRAAASSVAARIAADEPDRSATKALEACLAVR